MIQQALTHAPCYKTLIPDTNFPEEPEDRQAMLLRFFQNQGYQSVGAALGISDDAAQKRVGRALEKLRARLARHGITTTTAMLSGVLSTHAIQCAPAGLAAKLTGASLAGAAAKTTTTLIIMTTAFKTGIVATGIAAGLAVWLVAEHRSLNQMQDENAALRQQISQLGQPPQPQTAVNTDNAELERLRREHLELMRLRGQVGILRDTLEKKQGELASAQSENAQTAALKDAELKAKANRILTLNILKQIGVACRVYAGNNGDVLPTNFAQIKNELANIPFDSGVSTNTFEFHDYGEPLSSSATPYYFYAREKQPFQMPDGQWSRTYLLIDGSAQRAGSDDGNFDTWEKNWIQGETQRAAQQAAQAARTISQ